MFQLILNFKVSCTTFMCIVLSVHCKWSAFGEWSICSKTCGYGEQKRTRNVEIQNAHGGMGCSGPRDEMRLCKKRDCPGMVYKIYSFRINNVSL